MSRHQATMRAPSTVCVLVAVAQCFAWTARAAAPVPTPAAESSTSAQPAQTRAERGAELYAEGTAAYGEGRYEDAIVTLTAAYDLLNEPLLLYNIALCYGHLEQPAQAITHYQRYRALAPQSEWADVDRRIAALQADSEAKSKSTTPPTTEPEPEPAQSPSSPEPTPQLDDDRRVFGAGAIVVTTLTIAAAAAGTGLGLVALRGKNDAEAGCASAESGTTVCTVDSEDSRTQSRRLGIGADVAFGVAGLSAIVLIAVLAAQGAKRKRARRAAVSVAPTRRGGIVGLRWSI